MKSTMIFSQPIQARQSKKHQQEEYLFISLECWLLVEICRTMRNICSDRRLKDIVKTDK